MKNVVLVTLSLLTSYFLLPRCCAAPGTLDLVEFSGPTPGF